VGVSSLSDLDPWKLPRPEILDIRSFLILCYWANWMESSLGGCQVASSLEVMQQLSRHGGGAHALSIRGDSLKGHFRVHGLLVGVVNACEALNKTLSSLFVQALGVTLLADSDGHLHEDFNELALGQAGANTVPVLGVWGDEADEGDDAVLSKELGDLANPANVLNAV
jgi:hypothetical protein